MIVELSNTLEAPISVFWLTFIYYNAALLGLGFWYLRVFGYTVVLIYIDIDIPEGSFIQILFMSCIVFVIFEKF